jgi:hypothetical protein
MSQQPPPEWQPYGDQQPPQWASPAAPPPAPVAKKKRRWPWVVGAILLLFVIVGVSGNDSTPTVPQAAPPPQPTAGELFVKDFKSYPGLQTTMSHQDLIGIASKVCDAIGTPGITYDNLVAGIGTSKLGPQVAPVLVNAANRSYCPGKTYSSAGVPAYQAPAAAAPAAASGPLTTFSSGTYEVGTGDGQVASGKYKTAGPGADSYGSCYWARLKNTDGDFDSIITNGNAEGPTTVTISKTDGAFETRCTWTKSG